MSGAWGLLAEGIKDTVNIANQWITNKYNYDKSIEMWKRQNAYNHPKEQIKRLKEAGLNPALVYGNGATALSTQAPKYEPMEPRELGKGLDMFSYQQLRNMQLQGDLIRAQKESTEWDSDLKAEEAIARHRENKAFEESSRTLGITVSRSDSPWFRMGGRVFDWFRMLDERRGTTNKPVLNYKGR